MKTKITQVVASLRGQAASRGTPHGPASPPASHVHPSRTIAAAPDDAA
jgi:hypothetical protein